MFLLLFQKRYYVNQFISPETDYNLSYTNTFSISYKLKHGMKIKSIITNYELIFYEATRIPIILLYYFILY